MEWLFDGLGTEIIVLIIGIAGGGALGYRIGIKKNTLKQSQKAKDDANQMQVGDSKYTANIRDTNLDVEIEKNKVQQSQTAGNKASQTQIGGIGRE